MDDKPRRQLAAFHAELGYIIALVSEGSGIKEIASLTKFIYHRLDAIALLHTLVRNPDNARCPL